MIRPVKHFSALWYLLPLLLAFLVGCSKGAPVSQPPAGSAKSEPGAAAPAKAEPEKPTSGKTAAEGLTQLYTDPKSGLTVKLPAQWAAALREGAVVALLSPQNGEEDLFRENVLITADAGFKELSLEAYRKSLEAEVRKRYPDTKTLESGELQIDGLKALWGVDSFTGPGGASKVYRVVLVRGQVAYVFHGTALARTFDRYRPTFEAIAGSMAWKQTEAKP